LRSDGERVAANAQLGDALAVRFELRAALAHAALARRNALVERRQRRRRLRLLGLERRRLLGVVGVRRLQARQLRRRSSVSRSFFVLKRPARPCFE
jgi:hypothetical protein